MDEHAKAVYRKEFLLCESLSVSKANARDIQKINTIRDEYSDRVISEIVLKKNLGE